jgi:hypothetical protein
VAGVLSLIGCADHRQRVYQHQRDSKSGAVSRPGKGTGCRLALRPEAIFGGTAEYIALWLKDWHHESYYYWYITICIFISLMVYVTMKDTKDNSSLNQDSDHKYKG